MELLGDVGYVESRFDLFWHRCKIVARFGPFGDCANHDATQVHGLH
jgi:hypothetical protein